MASLETPANNVEKKSVLPQLLEKFNKTPPGKTESSKDNTPPTNVMTSNSFNRIFNSSPYAPILPHECEDTLWYIEPRTVCFLSYFSFFSL